MALQGQVSANLAAVTTSFLLLCILFPFKIADAATHIVGDSSGWDFNVRDWPPDGETFADGDILVFNYDTKLHNVVKVDIQGYNNCEVSPGSKIFTSGNDSIAVITGHNYFICGFPGHCNKGMNIDVYVA